MSEIVDPRSLMFCSENYIVEAVLVDEQTGLLKLQTKPINHASNDLPEEAGSN